MIITGKTDSDSLYLRLTTGVIEIHLESFRDAEGEFSVCTVYKSDEVILKTFGLVHDVLNKIRNICGNSPRQ